MSSGPRKLQELEATLSAAGDDPVRLDLVRRAQRFKRSWVELAEALSRVARSREYQGWGYSDLHEYCAKELSIKAATVDKLVLSYTAVQSHAPQLLQADGPARSLPSQDAVHYFAKAVQVEPPEGLARGRGDADDSRRLDVPGDVVDQLRQAVFEQGDSVGELRKRFDPIIRPKSPDTLQAEALRRARGAGKRFLQAVQEVDGLTEKRIARAQAAVDAVLRDLDELESQSAVEDVERV